MVQRSFSARIILIGIVIAMSGCSTPSTTSTTSVASRAPAPTGRGALGTWPFDSTKRCEVTNLGALVNSHAMEYAPSLGPGGLTLYFVSNRTGGPGGNDFWMTSKWTRFDTVFTPAQCMGTPLNGTGNENGIAVGHDGKAVYFSACNRADGAGDCDIFEGRLEDAGASGVHPLKRINSKYAESQPALSADGRILYFVSNRPTGKDREDHSYIYASSMLGDGSWSSPRRLAETVNGGMHNESPCITMNGKALLFVSDRAGGHGGFDIYVSWLQADGSWGAAVNLGAPFNTSADERSVAATTVGDLIYFASKRADMQSFGDLDLYMGRIVE
ncbi:MAG TPA: hypothetical protein VHI13_06270 [Candidatus Kapabacteria bacterium]|nr:hypothetical protein [Candidatus Kapabacteria bacterium]